MPIIKNENIMDNITFTETINMERVEQWVNLSYDDWYIKFGIGDIKKQGRMPRPKTYYKITRRELTKLYKAQCSVKTILYKYAKGQTKGRLYANEWGIQRLSAVDRNYLCMGQGLYDLDMKSAHPSIALYLAKKYNVNTPLLYKYVNDRETVLKQYALTKKDILIAMNSDEIRTSNDFLVRFNIEIDNLKNKVVDNEETGELVEGEIRNKKNPKSSKFNKILCVYENEILQTVINLIGSEKVCSLWYDGMFLKYKHPISEINKATEKWGMKWAYKPIHSNVKLDKDTEGAYRKMIDFFSLIENKSQLGMAELYRDILKENDILDDYVCLRTNENGKIDYCWYRYNKFNIIENHGNQPPNDLYKLLSLLREKIRESKNVAQELLEMKSDKYKEIERVAKGWEQKLGNNTYKKSLMNEFREIVLQDNDSFVNSIDLNNHILPFKNGRCFDFNINQYRDISKDDLVMKCIGYNSPENTPSAVEKKAREEVNNFLESIFENNSVLKFVLDTLAFSLYTNKFEKFYIWEAVGRNGKGVLLNLLSRSLGRFFYSPNGQFLTTGIKSGVADSSLYNCNDKRIVMVSEPENESSFTEIKFNIPKIKKLTGRDIIETRKLYGNPIEFIPQFTLFLMCNSIPFTEDCDSAMMDRMVCVKFPYRFCYQPLEDTEKQIDTSLKGKFLKEVYYRQFMYILLEHAKTITEQKLIIPQAVREETDKYFSGNDVVKPFIDAYYTVLPDESKDKFFVKCEDIYKDYLNNNSGKRISKKVFMNYMKKNGFEYKRNQSQYCINEQVVKSIGRGYFGLYPMNKLHKIPQSYYKQMVLSDDDDDEQPTTDDDDEDDILN